MSKKVPCNCVQCKESISTKDQVVSVFWFSGTARDGYRVHHERDVHVTVREGAVVRIEEQPEFSAAGFLVVGHQDCTSQVSIDPFTFNPFESMSHEAAVEAMIRLVVSAISAASRRGRRTRQRQKGKTSAVA